jgi:hypothetical protein
VCLCFSVITVNVITVCVIVCYCVFVHAQRTVLEIVSEPLHANFMKLYHTGRYCNEDMKCSLGECQFASFHVRRTVYCTGPMRMECSLSAHNPSARKDCVIVSR